MVGNAPPRMWLFTKGESNRWVPLVILPHRGILLFSPLFLRSDVFAALPSCQCGSMSRAYSTVTEWNSYSSHKNDLIVRVLVGLSRVLLFG